MSIAMKPSRNSAFQEASIDDSGQSTMKQHYICTFADQTLDIDHDPPETPAPIFALKAFKHAIFGTPKPEARPNLLKKAHEGPTAQHAELREHKTRNRKQPRRKSADNTRAEAGSNKVADDALSKKPGILLTPGIEGTRRKTVSFGKYTKEEEQKDASPYKTTSLRYNTMSGSGVKNSFTQTLLDSRNEATSSRPTSSSGLTGYQGEGQGAQQDTLELSEPRSKSGRYWKAEFESYSARSQLEMRKLMKKEQLAKRYAKHADSAMLLLREELELEKAKVSRLEKQVHEYNALLKRSISTQKVEGSHISQKEDTRQDYEPPPIRNSQSVRVSRRQSSAPDYAQVEKLRDGGQANLTRRFSTTEAHRPLDSRTRKPQLEAESNSDIWAEVASVPKDTHDSSRKVSNSFRDRAPLGERHANATALGDFTKPKMEVKERDISSERREAAMKRLQARKLAREKDRVKPA